MRIAGGRVFYIALNYGMPKRLDRDNRISHLICRDAFNGSLIWKRKIEDVPGRGDNPPRFTLTATGDRVYCLLKSGDPLQALDAKTGETLFAFNDGAAPPAIAGRDFRKLAGEELHYLVRVTDGKVVQAHRRLITCSDEKDGKLLWKHELPEGKLMGWVVAGDGKVFVAVAKQPLAKIRASPAADLGKIIALDLISGDPLWENDDFDGRAIFRMCYHRGSLFVPGFANVDKKHDKPNWRVARIDGKTGDPIWVNEEAKAGLVGGHYSTVIAHGDEVLVGQQSGFALDFETGNLLRKLAWGQHDNSCADLKCVPGFSMYGLTFINELGERIIRGQTRSICDTGNFPAYGLLYGLPSACLCAEYINGHLAMSAEKPRAEIEDTKRLTRGEAKGGVDNASAELAKGWPMHLADPERSSYTGESVPADLSVLWTKRIAEKPAGAIGQDWDDNEQIVGPTSAATATAERVFVAASDRHQVQCRDAKTGDLLWKFTAGGRIDSPPTLLNGVCLFGSRDGSVYGLRSENGALIWKFFAGRYDRRIAVQSQLESAWPVHGSVTIHDGGAIFTAGRQTAVDGGIQLFKVDPLTGKMIWKTRLWTDPDLGKPSKWQWRNRRLQDLLVRNRDGEVCLWITPTKNTYAPGEEVDIFSRVYPVRAVAYYRDKEHDKVSDATWLRSASSNGLLSRRVESVGRHDKNGVSYAQLDAEKIAIAPNAIYAVNARAPKPHALNGGLVKVPLEKDGTISATAPKWKAGPFGHGHVAAFAVAGDKILGSFASKEGSELRICSVLDGEILTSVQLPAPAVRDGIAVAGGRIFISCRNGDLVCLGRN